MIKACSHLVLATENVELMSQFFEEIFLCQPHFKNREFADFVLPSRFRVAFFLPVGKAAELFSASKQRRGSSIGVTVDDVDKIYRRILDHTSMELKTSGPPKQHPWGEKSFLLIDPDDNRWEITESPSQDGLLVNKEFPA